MSKPWAHLFILACLFTTPALSQEVKLGEQAAIDPPVLEAEEPTADAMSIREAFAQKIGEQLSGRQARLFANRDRYRERLIDEAIDRAITQGLLDPTQAFDSPQSVVTEIMAETPSAQEDGRPARDWKAFFEALQPFLEFLMQLLAGLGAFG